jgi:hypothetical protein
MYGSKKIRIMPKNKYATQTWKTDNISAGGAAEASRTNLITSDTWSITDLGGV